MDLRPPLERTDSQSPPESSKVWSRRVWTFGTTFLILFQFQDTVTAIFEAFQTFTEVTNFDSGMRAAMATAFCHRLQWQALLCFFGGWAYDICLWWTLMATFVPSLRGSTLLDTAWHCLHCLTMVKWHQEPLRTSQNRLMSATTCRQSESMLSIFSVHSKNLQLPRWNHNTKGLEGSGSHRSGC